PKEYADWITKQFNLFSDIDELSFVDMPTIKRNNKTIDIETLKGKKCVGGFDLSETEDFTAAVLEFPLETGEVFILQHTWIPQARFDRDNNQERIKAWEKVGDLTIIPGDYVNYEYVLNWFVENSKIYDIVKINYDKAKALRLNKELENAGFETNEIRQGFLSLGGPMQNFKEMLLDGKVIFNNSKLYRWYLSNVKLVMDRNSNWMPSKQSKSRKIDGFAASLNSHAEVLNMLVNPVGTGKVTYYSISDLMNM
ncbi:terminase large subunit, partial [Enterococcus faecium]|nr:terminase large subunit [Enterococcus faecium]